jgi:hypothetical protein
MRKTVARLFLKTMARRYDYDVTYMLALLDQSPSAFAKFAKLFALARHRESAPRSAVYAAKLAGALFEDCGPCSQLVINMAREAGVAADQIEAVLTRRPEAMSPDTALGFRFAEAILRRACEEDEVREAVRAQWGEKGVIDLTLALQIGRVFPMLKAGLGYAKECRRVSIDGRSVDVVKRAA